MPFTELSKRQRTMSTMSQRTQDARLVGEARGNEGQGEEIRQKEGGSKPVAEKQTEEFHSDGQDFEEV